MATQTSTKYFCSKQLQLVFNTHIHTKEKNMSKTPYEIRLELLKLAKDSLFEPVYTRRDALKDEFYSKMSDQNKGTIPYPTLPSFPSTDDIVAEAEKLNKFISQ